MHATASMLGMAVGGMLIIALLSMFLEWAIFKRVVGTPPVGITLSVIGAVIVATILYGFGNANGGPWDPLPGAIAYIIAGVVVWALRMWGYRKRAAAAEGLDETFE